MATLTSPTLERLIKEIRIFLNEQSSDNSFWSDEELTLYINDGVRLYFQEITDRAEGQFDATPASLNLVQGVDTVALPSDCFYVKALYRVESGRNKMLNYSNNLTEDYDTQGMGSGGSYEPSYYFRGNNIVLRPVPPASETGGLLLEYTSFPETMISGNDQLTSNISPVFKELVVMYAVYKAKVKESLVNGRNTAAMATEHLAQVYKKFRESVSSRSKYPVYTRPFIP